MDTGPVGTALRWAEVGQLMVWVRRREVLVVRAAVRGTSRLRGQRCCAPGSARCRLLRGEASNPTAGRYKGIYPCFPPTPCPCTQRADTGGSAPVTPSTLSVRPAEVAMPTRACGDDAELGPSVAVGRQSGGPPASPAHKEVLRGRWWPEQGCLLLPRLSQGTRGRQRDGRLSGGSPSRREPSWLCRGSLFLYGNEEFRLMELNHL